MLIFFTSVYIIYNLYALVYICKMHVIKGYKPRDTYIFSAGGCYVWEGVEYTRQVLRVHDAPFRIYFYV